MAQNLVTSVPEYGEEAKFKLKERSQNRMAVMSKKVDAGFMVAPNKSAQFLEKSASSKSLAEAMSRAQRNIPDFGKKEVKRK